jgi:hypothetical protein
LEKAFQMAIPFTQNSEVELGRANMFRGAHASRVWFSASRRKPRSTNFSPLDIPGRVCEECSGATPELARGTRALPIPVSEFGFNIAAPGLRGKAPEDWRTPKRPASSVRQRLGLRRPSAAITSATSCADASQDCHINGQANSPGVFTMHLLDVMAANDEDAR